jgi:hypothetical protein
MVPSVIRRLKWIRGGPEGVVFSKLSKLLNQGRTERTLFWDNFSYPQARLRGAQECCGQT